MKMLKNELNLEFTKGDTLSFGVEIYNLGQPLEAAYFTCRANYDDGANLFQKSLNNGITLSSSDEFGNYIYVVRVAPEDTENLIVGKYYYDMQIELNGDVFTILKGVLTIDYDVTRERVE